MISVQVQQNKIDLVKKNIATLRSLKGTRPIVAVTAYDTVMARLADAAGVDLILVGDSVGTVQLGFETTVPVRLEMMLHHTAAVARARVEALVVADIPFAVAHDLFNFQTRGRADREQHRGDRRGLLANSKIEADDDAEVHRVYPHFPRQGQEHGHNHDDCRRCVQEHA